MTRFSEWCTFKNFQANPTGKQPSPPLIYDLLVLVPAQEGHAVKIISKSLSSYYADPSRIAGLLKKLGKAASAKYVRTKLPSLPNIRSGDLGEILCNAYVVENTEFKLGIKRLRWKDHRNMSMRGEDVLAFSLGAKSSSLRVLKAEVKSGGTMRTSVIKKARLALDKDSSLPSPHALSFVADRLNQGGEEELCEAIDSVMLKGRLKASQVTHMLFTFSGNDPSKEILKSLEGYSGAVSQHYVALQVSTHDDFIKSVFDEVEL
jgi:hypothetical protein